MRHIGLGRFPKRKRTLDPLDRIPKHPKRMKLLHPRFLPGPLLNAPMSLLVGPVKAHPWIVVEHGVVGFDAPLLHGIVLDEGVFDEVGPIGQFGFLGQYLRTEVQVERVEERGSTFLYLLHEK